MAATDGGASPIRRHRVLIVEDEILVAMELETLLRRQGYEVIGPVPTVTRALALLDREQPDAVLLDLDLNGDPAIPVAAALLARCVPFVILSGYSGRQSKELELQNAPRVNKPVKERELMRVLSRLLPSR